MQSKSDTLTVDPRGPLMPRELACAQIIQEWNDRFGYSPNLEELRVELDLRSRSGAHKAVTGLVEKGWAVRSKALQRGVRLTGRVPMPLEFTDTRELVNVALEAIEELRRLERFQARALELANKLNAAIGGGRPSVEMTKLGHVAADETAQTQSVLIPVRPVNATSTSPEGAS